MLSAACTCGLLDQPPKGIAGRSGADGWMNGLPKKKARPEPNSISAMPMAMSLTFGNLQIQPWNRPKQAPVADAASTPSQGEAGHDGDRIGGHRAEHQYAFEAEIDAAGALGDGFAQRHEDEGRGDPDRAAEDRQRHAPEADVGVVHQALLFHRSGLKILKRP